MSSLKGSPAFPLPSSAGFLAAPSTLRGGFLSRGEGAAKSPFCHYCKVTHWDADKKRLVVEWFDLVFCRPSINFISEEYRASLEDEPRNVLQLEYPSEAQGFEFGSYVIPELMAMDCRTC